MISRWDCEDITPLSVWISWEVWCYFWSIIHCLWPFCLSLEAFRSFSLFLKVKVSQSCLTLCHPMDYTVHGILQVRILEWVAFPFSSGSSWPRNRTRVSCIAGRFFTNWAMREALIPHIFKSYNDEPWFGSLFIHCTKHLSYNLAMWRPTIWGLVVFLHSFFGNFFLSVFWNCYWSDRRWSLETNPLIFSLLSIVPSVCPFVLFWGLISPTSSTSPPTDIFSFV